MAKGPRKKPAASSRRSVVQRRAEKRSSLAVRSRRQGKERETERARVLAAVKRSDHEIVLAVVQQDGWAL
eukprot:4563886-Amphidinium_carterae.1